MLEECIHTSFEVRGIQLQRPKHGMGTTVRKYADPIAVRLLKAGANPTSVFDCDSWFRICCCLSIAMLSVAMHLPSAEVTEPNPSTIGRPYVTVLKSSSCTDHHCMTGTGEYCATNTGTHCVTR